ncbi:hypothetical protein [Streptomyces sp. NPDC050264]|uniref:hypothetical protein n=1 Tax=Streptomyces sp. NPDC050264 TaxID=3155038 RepID=UPI00341E06E3
MADAKDRFCRNCGRGYHLFRELEPDEREYVASQKGPDVVDRYRRCTNDGCLRVQRYHNASEGLDLPEHLR